MQLGIGKTLLPAWAASLTLVRDHGTAAVRHATDAIQADDPTTRLDSSVQAMLSFDHGIDNVGKLPVQWFLPDASRYLGGYEAAKQAVALLVASGVIPGARERVGQQALLAARETFLNGVAVARSDDTRFGSKLASGWLEATAEDALMGAGMLRPSGTVGRDLLLGIAQVRRSVQDRRPLDEQLVRTVDELFGRAGSELAAAIEQADSTPQGPIDETAFTRSGALLAQARDAAQALVAGTPSDSILDGAAPVAG